MRICVDIKTGLQVTCGFCERADRCPMAKKEEEVKETTKDQKRKEA